MPGSSSVSVPVRALGSFLPVLLSWTIYTGQDDRCFSAREGSGVFSTNLNVVAIELCLSDVSVPVRALGSFLPYHFRGFARFSPPIAAYRLANGPKNGVHARFHLLFIRYVYLRASPYLPKPARCSQNVPSKWLFFALSGLLQRLACEHRQKWPYPPRCSQRATARGIYTTIVSSSLSTSTPEVTSTFLRQAWHR